MLTCLIDTLILALNFRHLPQSAQYYYHNDEDDDPTEDVLSKQGKGIFLPAKELLGCHRYDCNLLIKMSRFHLRI